MGNIIELKNVKKQRAISKKVNEIYKLMKKAKEGKTTKEENERLEKLFEDTTCGDLTRLDDKALKEMIEFAIDSQEFAKKCEPVKGEDDWPTNEEDFVI